MFPLRLLCGRLGRVAVASRSRRGRVASRGASVPCGSAFRARRAVRCVVLCHGDCCWAGSCGCRCAVGICGSGASRVSRGWRCAMGLLFGGSRGCRCAMGIAVGRVAWVPLCHEVCLVCVSRGCRCAMKIASVRVAWGAAVPWGLLLGGSRGCCCAMGIAARRVTWVPCCAMGIAARRVAWVPLCHGDLLLGGLRGGAAVPWGLLVCVSRGVAAGRVACVSLCHRDCCSAGRVGGAVSWGLLTRAWSGWRRVFGIAGTGGSRRSGEPKRLLLKGRACTESSFLGFGTGPGVGEAGLVQNRHF